MKGRVPEPVPARAEPTGNPRERLLGQRWHPRPAPTTLRGPGGAPKGGSSNRAGAGCAPRAQPPRDARGQAAGRGRPLLPARGVTGTFRGERLPGPWGGQTVQVEIRRRTGRPRFSNTSLRFCERPTRIPVFAHGKKSEKVFTFTRKEAHGERGSACVPEAGRWSAKLHRSRSASIGQMMHTYQSFLLSLCVSAGLSFLCDLLILGVWERSNFFS